MNRAHAGRCGGPVHEPHQAQAWLGLLALSGACPSAIAAGATVTRTYTTEGTQGMFVVPAGVEAIDVVVVGGAGASSSAAKGWPGRARGRRADRHSR
jgi:hypothetical protein